MALAMFVHQPAEGSANQIAFFAHAKHSMQSLFTNSQAGWSAAQVLLLVLDNKLLGRLSRARWGHMLPIMELQFWIVSGKDKVKVLGSEHADSMCRSSSAASTGSLLLYDVLRMMYDDGWVYGRGEQGSTG